MSVVLYTSIQHTKGIQAVSKFLDGHNYDTLSKSFCLDLLELVLTNNFFLFGDQFYIQKQGTAMGCNMAPPYAKIYMAIFEKDYIYNHHLFQTHAITWLRYIDDIFCVWTGSSEDLNVFHNYLNSIYTELQFTMNSDNIKMNFLDTMVQKDNMGHISFDLYTKPTDRNSLLHFSSNHPPPTPKSHYLLHNMSGSAE